MMNLKTRIQRDGNNTKVGTVVTVAGIRSGGREISTRPFDSYCYNPYEGFTTNEEVKGRRFKILKVDGSYWEIEHLPREGEESKVGELPFKIYDKSFNGNEPAYLCFCNVIGCGNQIPDSGVSSTRFCNTHHPQAFGDGPDPFYGKPNPYLTVDPAKPVEEPKPVKRFEMLRYSQYATGLNLKIRKIGSLETIYFESYVDHEGPYMNIARGTKLSDFTVGEVYRVDEHTSSSTWLELVSPTPLVDVERIIESSKCQSVESSEKSLTREHEAGASKESGMKLYTGGVVTRTSTVAAGEGVSTGKEIKVVVHQVSVAFYAPNDETARALVLMDAVEAKKITKDDLSSPLAPLTVALSCPNCVI